MWVHIDVLKGWWPKMLLTTLNVWYVHVDLLIHLQTSWALEASRGLRGYCNLFYAANFNGFVQIQYVAYFPFSLWYVWPHLDSEYKFGPHIGLLFHIWDHYSSYQSIHAALDFIHIKSEDIAQIDT